MDDGSTDDSGRMIEEFAKKDSRISVFHKENGGLSSARNAGLEAACGEYITFLDSDDWVSENYIERLYQLITDYQGDIAGIGLKKVWTAEGEGSTAGKAGRNEKANVKTEDTGAEKPCVRIYGSTQAIAEMCYQRSVDNCACGKLYRASLFREIRYPVGKLYEDLATTYRLLWEAEKIVYSSEKLYYYFQHEESIMFRPFDKRNMDRITVSRELLCWTAEKERELQEAAAVRFFVSNVQVLREIPLREEYREELALVKDNIRKYRRQVRKNKRAKASIRIIAAFSFLDVRLLQYLGNIYKKVYQ